MQTSLHFNKAIVPCHDLQTDLPCLYVLNHGLWHKWNCLHRCPTRYGGIGSQSLQKYAKLLATKVSNDSIIQICRVLFVVIRCSVPFSKSTTVVRSSSISSLSVKGTPATQEKNGGPSTCLEARSPSKCDKCDAAIFAVVPLVPFTACIFQMDFGFCFCSILLTYVVHSLHQKLFDSHMSQ